MSEKNAGNDPAYPVIGAPCAPKDYPDLTKRELFAAMAMQGICTHADTWGQTIDGIAVQSVCIADALLAELAKAGPA